MPWVGLAAAFLIIRPKSQTNVESCPSLSEDNISHFIDAKYLSRVALSLVSAGAMFWIFAFVVSNSLLDVREHPVDNLFRKYVDKDSLATGFLKTVGEQASENMFQPEQLEEINHELARFHTQSDIIYEKLAMKPELEQRKKLEAEVGELCQSVSAEDFCGLLFKVHRKWKSLELSENRPIGIHCLCRM